MKKNAFLPILLGILALSACAPSVSSSISSEVPTTSSETSESTSSSSEATSSPSSISTSSDPNAWNKTKIRDALTGLESVGLKGTFQYHYSLAGMGETDNTYNSEGYYSPDLYYLRSELVGGTEYDYESEWAYRTEDGYYAEKYLDRDNVVKEAKSDVKFDENFIHPFADLELSHITYDQSINRVDISVSSEAIVYPFHPLMFLTVHMSDGNFYEPDTFAILMTDDLKPLRMVASGHYTTSFSESYVIYTGEFVTKDDLQINDPVPYERQAGHENLANMLGALKTATSYTASMSSLVTDSDGVTTTKTGTLKVVEGKGAYDVSDDGTIEGTYAAENGFYRIDGAEGSVAHASSALLEGDAVDGYFDENAYTAPITPDFDFSESLFSVNEDGSYTFLPKEMQSIAYLMIPDTSWSHINTATQIYPAVAWLDPGTVKFSGSVETGIVIYYEANGGRVKNTITITGINATEYPYTSISTAA